MFHLSRNIPLISISLTLSLSFVYLSTYLSLPTCRYIRLKSLQEVAERVSKHLIANMDKIRIKRINDGVAPGAGVKWTAAKTID